MEIKRLIKNGLKIVFAKRPIHTTANIVTLAPNELLKGRCALVTGGTSGIGFAIAKAFLSSGASVCITGRDEKRLHKAYSELINDNSIRGAKIAYIVLDNADTERFQLKLEEASQAIGTLDILVNNAGIHGGDISKVNSTEYDSIMNTNLRGAFFLSQIFGKKLVDSHVRGNILNICSSSSLRPAISAYSLSKWGLRGLTIGLAKSLAPYGITVNGVAPGPTATPMLMKNDRDNITNERNPFSRYLTPEEVANMAVFLVSDMGRMIVGDIVYMTGGAGTITYDDVNYSF